MRNKINAIIILLAIALLIFATLRGVKIGNFELLSISGLVEKNNYLENKIEEAATLTSVNYPDNIDALEEVFENYKIQKQKYEQLSSTTSKEDTEKYETKQYDIGYLWRVLGKYATEQKFTGDPGLTLGIDVKKVKKGNSIYNFDFTLIGTYTRISQFLIDIENDSDLYFRIYNFNMVPNETSDKKGEEGVIVRATFTVKNINIDPSTIS